KADETGGGAKWLAVVAVLVVGALAGGWFFLQPLWQPTPSTRRDGEKPGELHRFTDHKKEIFGLAFSGDGQRLVAACLDQTASIWNVESGEKERIIPGFRGPLTCAAWPAKQPRVLFGCKTLANQGLFIVDVPTGTGSTRTNPRISLERLLSIACSP